MKNDTDIEQELTQQSQISLSSTDKAKIKAELMRRATDSLNVEANQPIISPFSTWIHRGYAIVALLLLVFVGTTYASKDSLPGEPLYALKVNVLEETISLSKIDPVEHTNYEISRMESRLLELKELNSTEQSLNSDSLNDLTEKIDEHIEDIRQSIDSDSAGKISGREKINTLSKLSGIVKAQEKIIENNEKFLSARDDLDQTGLMANGIFEAEIDDFTETESADVVNQYLSDELKELETRIMSSSTNEVERESYRADLLNLEEAILVNDFAEAITTILEVEQEDLIEQLLMKVEE